MKHSQFLVCILLFLISCQSTPTVFSEAVRQYANQEDSGLTQHQTLDNIQFSFQYIPTTYRVLKELDFTITDTLQYQQRIQETSGQHQVLFKIAPANKQQSLEKIYQQGANPLPWETILKILHFRLQDKFELQVNGQGIPCRIYHLLPSLRSTDGYQFLLTFEGEKESTPSAFTGDLQFRFVDTYFSGKEVQFTIPHQTLVQIPQLNLKRL